MSKILIIDATGRSSEDSKTKLLSEAVLTKMNLDSHQVTFLDLYQCQLPNVNKQILDSRKSLDYTADVARAANQYVEQFEAADHYIFIFPTWNWSVPAILKQYIDIIMVSGRSFTYRGFKIVGLLEGKKATIINTTGGPVFSNMVATLFGNQNGVNYMTSMLKIMGIKDINKVVIDKTSYKFKNKDKNLNFDIDLYNQEVKKIVAKL